MQLLLRRLGLIQRAEVELEYERRHARLMATRAAQARIQQLHQHGMISTPAWEQLAPELERQFAAALAAQHDLLREHPSLRAEEREDAWREGLRAQRAMLTALLRDGVISEAVYEELVTEVDAALQKEAEERQITPAG